MQGVQNFLHRKMATIRFDNKKRVYDYHYSVDLFVFITFS